MMAWTEQGERYEQAKGTLAGRQLLAPVPPRSKSPARRRLWRIIRAWEESGDLKLYEKLVKATYATEWPVREEATISLDVSRSFDRLIEIMETDPVDWVARAAERTISERAEDGFLENAWPWGQKKGAS